MSKSIVSNPYLQDKEFLKLLDETKTKELFVKIVVLDRQEDVVEEIQGKVSSGSLNIDGTASLRRTGNLTFIPNVYEGNLTDVNNIISINKKVQVEIGLTNTLTLIYPFYNDYPIIWFPQGIFVLTDVNMSQTTTGSSISIQIQDKMCLLNGSSGGTISAAATLHSATYLDGDGKQVEEWVRIYQIIRELVNHFGGEDLDKIIVSDIEARVKQLIKWTPSSPPDKLYKYPNGDHEYILSKILMEGRNDEEEISPEANFGYRFTDFVFPEELTADVNQSVCDILDKIKSVLGNYEYFYDINGNFIFQEIKNYLNTSSSQVLIDQTNSKAYMKDIGVRSKTVYDFKDGNLINSFSNTPSYATVKNDFVVWGARTDSLGTSTPIRFHLVLDQKPKPVLKNGNGDFEDWRNVLYRQGVAASPYGIDSNYYYKELTNEWPKLYDSTNLVWKEDVLKDSSAIDYYLDFIDTTHSLNELSVSNIGRRIKVIQNQNINCLFAPVIADLIVIEMGSLTEVDDIQSAINQGMDYTVVSSNLFKEFNQGVAAQDAFSTVRDMLYEGTSYNTSITLQTIPIYYLDANTRISVCDKETGTNGDFMIKSIGLSFSTSDTMSISAIEVLERI